MRLTSLVAVPELPSNYLTAAMIWTVTLLFAFWVLLNVYFTPLLLVFLPATLTILYIFPILLMKLPAYGLHKVAMKYGIKSRCVNRFRRRPMRYPSNTSFPLQIQHEPTSNEGFTGRDSRGHYECDDLQILLH